MTLCSRGHAKSRRPDGKGWRCYTCDNAARDAWRQRGSSRQDWSPRVEAYRARVEELALTIDMNVPLPRRVTIYTGEEAMA